VRSHGHATEALCGRNVFHDLDQAVGVGARQRTHEHRIHHAEHRRGGPDPKCQRQAHGSREYRSAVQLPKAVSDIGAEIVDPSHTAHLEGLLLPAQRIAEVPACATLSVGRRHAAGHQRIDVRIEMRSPFRLHVRFDSSS
jgi:hypothetical protein